MSEPETQTTATELAEGETPAVPEEATPPAPEPWTPQGVLEWNHYYDLYVAAAVLLLVFLGSAHPIVNPTLWTDLQTGRLILENGRPVTRDPFSYTMFGRPWVNIPWLYQVASAALHDALAGLNFPDPEQAAAVGLVALNAGIRALTALLLLGLRRPGPGLWWNAVVVLLALGAILTPYPGGSSPILPVLGGIARAAEVDSGNWGMLLLAAELLLLCQALYRGLPGALWGLIPLFLLWANVDESFLYGLVVLALIAVGSLFRGAGPAADDPPAPGPARLFVVLMASAAACMLNPSLHMAFVKAAAPFTGLFQRSGVLTVNQLSYFGPESQKYFNRVHGGEDTGTYRLYVAYYAILVGIGLASFMLNRRRFDVGRFLVFAFAAVAWGALVPFGVEFALIWAATLALNGQEWYHDRFGTEGRTERSWAVFSVGGRAVTLLVAFLLTVKGLTGYGASEAEPPFGFGFNPDDFAFEAADFLGTAPIEGNILNLTLANGDALIARAWPKNPARRTFIDGRGGLFPPSLQGTLQELRRAFYEGDSARWKAILDGYDPKVTVVMVPIGPGGDTNAARVYVGLSGSSDWIPFYDDGSVVLFGRADAPAADLAYFQENRLDAERMAFRVDRPVPSSDRPPTPTSWVDYVFHNRAKRLPQPHVMAAERWLTIRREDQNQNPGLAHCLLAIREARTALARNPDDSVAWRMLAESYRLLMIKEAQVLGAQQGGEIPIDYLTFRNQQRATALNYAIKSTPPPQTPEASDELARLNIDLAQLYSQVNFLDLARDRLEQARKLSRPGEFSEENQARLDQLDEHIAQVEEGLSDLAAEQQAGPLERARFALDRGVGGLAIRELVDADAATLGVVGVKAQLLDLYCQAGEPDEAMQLFSVSEIDDPQFNTGPGTSAYRQGMVYFLLGSYDLTASLWGDRSIRALRMAQGFQGLEAGRGLHRGQVREAAEAFLELPRRVGTQATWEIQLGLCLLEGGRPTQAGAPLQNALKLQPRHPLRPLLAEYLRLLGQEIPPEQAGETTGATSTASPGDAAPTPTTELPAEVFQKSEAGQP